MTSLPNLSPPPDGMTRVWAFSVATALAWIGHDCSGGCPDETTKLRANAWFVRTPGINARSSSTTLVVLDLLARNGQSVSGATPAVVATMLRQVNDCTRSEHIRVRERVSSDQGQP